MDAVLVHCGDCVRKGRVLESKERAGQNNTTDTIYKVRIAGTPPELRWLSEKVIERDGDGGAAAGGSAEGTRHHLLHLSPEIKQMLREDAQSVANTREEPLPFRASVTEILREFSEDLLKAKNSVPDEVKEAEKGLRDLFSFSLEHFCLYDCERRHFEERREKSVSDHYGAVHLLRVLAAFPKVRERLGLDAEVGGTIFEYVSLLVDFVHRNRDRL